MGFISDWADKQYLHYRDADNIATLSTKLNSTDKIERFLPHMRRQFGEVSQLSQQDLMVTFSEQQSHELRINRAQKFYEDLARQEPQNKALMSRVLAYQCAHIARYYHEYLSDKQDFALGLPQVASVNPVPSTPRAQPFSLSKTLFGAFNQTTEENQDFVAAVWDEMSLLSSQNNVNYFFMFAHRLFAIAVDSCGAGNPLSRGQTLEKAALAHLFMHCFPKLNNLRDQLDDQGMIRIELSSLATEITTNPLTKPFLDLLIAKFRVSDSDKNRQKQLTQYFAFTLLGYIVSQQLETQDDKLLQGEYAKRLKNNAGVPGTHLEGVLSTFHSTIAAYFNANAPRLVAAGKRMPVASVGEAGMFGKSRHRDMFITHEHDIDTHSLSTHLPEGAQLSDDEGDDDLFGGSKEYLLGDPDPADSNKGGCRAKCGISKESTCQLL